MASKMATLLAVNSGKGNRGRRETVGQGNVRLQGEIRTVRFLAVQASTLGWCLLFPRSGPRVPPLSSLNGARRRCGSSPRVGVLGWRQGGLVHWNPAFSLLRPGAEPCSFNSPLHFVSVARISPRYASLRQ